MQIGPYTLRNHLIVAPMAGVTDRPFRQLCKRYGAGHAVSEMISSDAVIFGRNKTIKRTDFSGELAPISAQIAGADPLMMAQAAQFQVDNGAQIIDINMGCPAKKVCNKLSGSALLQHEDLVKRILETVVGAVNVPVTLKTRLGFKRGEENILRIAQLAQDAGIMAITIHGRTREDFYTGNVRYELIRQVKQQLTIPVIANGDIDSPQKAKDVLEATQADALMIGRAAQGKPWIFRDVAHYLATGELLEAPPAKEIWDTVAQHLIDLYAFYGEYSGTRIARKHIAWYTQGLPQSNVFRQAMYQAETTAAQFRCVDQFFKQICLWDDQ